MNRQAQRCPVDLDHLARYTGGDASINAEILQMFAGQSADLMTQLHAVLQTHDLEAWKLITHSLKGAARGIGAFALADAAAHAEPLSPSADNLGTVQALQELKTQTENVQRFIGTYLAG
jgi:HPt (histidine-containing phosphotransfer) domain-containing protein